MSCGHGRIREMTGCCGHDLETGEQMYACLACGFQGTILEMNEGKPYGVGSAVVMDREELKRRYPAPSGSDE
jgi:hypothetical protein